MVRSNANPIPHRRHERGGIGRHREENVAAPDADTGRTRRFARAAESRYRFPRGQEVPPIARRSSEPLDRKRLSGGHRD